VSDGRERWTVAAEAAGERLDRHLAAHLDVSRNQAQGWIADGRVAIDGRPATKASHGLAGGEEIACEVPPPREETRVEPEAGELRLLHADDSLLVVDKPAGLVVHPGAGRDTGTLVHRILHHHPEVAGVGGAGRPGIVHRLDKDTSGVLVVARSATAYLRLQRAFAKRRVDKRYLAVVYGEPEEEGEIDAPIGRHPKERKRMAVVHDGRPAVSRWRRLAAVRGLSLVEVRILTGRTHQIRVHLKELRHPLVGDPVYGENRWKAFHGRTRAVLSRFPRPALHAWRLAFEHPASGEWVGYESPLPADLVELWEKTTGEAFPELPEATTEEEP